MAVILSLLAGLAACSSPSGPVEPTVADSPPTPVVIDPEIALYVVIPASPEPTAGQRVTADGLLIEVHPDPPNARSEDC
jgi:3-deoxy-D-arabino-heptulosonate 7-phosphate (DAHP) synthase